MTDTSLLRAEDLTVGYGRTPLLEGIRLDLPSGSLTALIGINGIGKSTLLRTLAGLHPVSYTHLRAHETVLDLVCRLLLEKKKKYNTISILLFNDNSSYRHRHPISYI